VTTVVELASTQEQFSQGALLFRAYAQFLGVDLEFQGFSSELKNVAHMYGPPKGALLLAKHQGSYVGVVGLREFAPGVAEMKRMFVSEYCHGKGIGKMLMKSFLSEASRLGYQKIYLDTIPELQSALQLYRSFGFEEIGPYRFNPHPEAIFLERALP
jgi:GNAT superfamily N-acetyltransferase